jgi:hypothetical protein
LSNVLLLCKSRLAEQLGCDAACRATGSCLGARQQVFDVFDLLSEGSSFERAIRAFRESGRRQTLV